MLCYFFFGFPSRGPKGRDSCLPEGQMTSLTSALLWGCLDPCPCGAGRPRPGQWPAGFCEVHPAGRRPSVGQPEKGGPLPHPTQTAPKRSKLPQTPQLEIFIQLSSLYPPFFPPHPQFARCCTFQKIQNPVFRGQTPRKRPQTTLKNPQNPISNFRTTWISPASHFAPQNKLT